MKKETFRISGMTCSACSAHVEKSVSKETGVKEVRVSLLSNSMIVEFDESIISCDDIIEYVKKAGYSAERYGINNKSKQNNSTGQQEDKHLVRLKRQFFVSIIFMIPLFYISMGAMLGLPIPSFLSGYENAVSYAFLQFLLCLPILYVNRNYYINGFRRLMQGAPNMDTLIAVGSSSAFVYGIYAIFQIGNSIAVGDMHSVMEYHMELYFESAAMILTLITLGKLFEERSKRKTGTAIRALMELAPQTAIVERNGAEIEIPAEEVVVDDIVIVKPGMRIPIDGVVIFGESTIDESALTGESIPVEKSVGDKVTCATMNQSGYLKIQAKHVGKDTAYSKIVALVEEASAGKAPIARLADKISAVFVPIVICIAILSCVIWLLAGADFSFALSCAISVLVISCPCALGLATPVAIMVGTGQGAMHGILIKSGEALQILQEVRAVVLDKTGTITEGKPTVSDIFPAKSDKDTLLKILYSLEKQSEHPISLAITEYAEKNHTEPLEVFEFTALHGKGVVGSIHDHVYYAGNAAFICEKCPNARNFQHKWHEFADSGKTPVLVADSEKLLGIVTITDCIKPSSIHAIKQLKDMKMDVYMLTGDNLKTANSVAESVGISNVLAEVLPDEKESKIYDIQSLGKKAVMVGDGINDAPALVRADVGIAIGAGTDVALESADIVLVRNDLEDVVSAIKLSKKVMQNIKQNLFWAFFYNTIGIPIAAGVFYPLCSFKLNPMFAAAAMSLSSICVVFNALRLRNFHTKSGQGKKASKKECCAMRLNVKIEGMMCKHCSGRVEQVLNSLDGVSACVDLENQTALVTVSGVTSQEQIQAAIEQAGYSVTSIQIM